MKPIEGQILLHWIAYDGRLLSWKDIGQYVIYINDGEVRGLTVISTK